MKNDQNNTYENVLAVFLLLLLLHYFFWPQPSVLVGIIVFLLSVLLFPRIARLVGQGWQQLTRAIGFVMSHVLMTLVFVLFLTPVAFVYRLFQANGQPTSAKGDTNFVSINRVYKSEDLKNPW